MRVFRRSCDFELSALPPIPFCHVCVCAPAFSNWLCVCAPGRWVKYHSIPHPAITQWFAITRHSTKCLQPTPALAHGWMFCAVSQLETLKELLTPSCFAFAGASLGYLEPHVHWPNHTDESQELNVSLTRMQCLGNTKSRREMSVFASANPPSFYPTHPFTFPFALTFNYLSLPYVNAHLIQVTIGT